MKKTRLVAVILLAAMLMNFTASCEGFDLNGLLNFGDSGSGDSLNLTSGYTIAYSRASDSDKRMEEMIRNAYAKFGGSVDSNPNKLKSFDKEIILGGVGSKEETKELVKSLKADTNDMLGAYVVRAIGKKVFVYASCPEAEKLAVDALFSYVENGKLVIPADLDLTVYFNLYEYKNSGELCIVSDGLSGIAAPAFIRVDGMPIWLEYGKYEYEMKSDPTQSLPTEEEIDIILYTDEMSYEVSHSDQSVVVTFNSKDGTKSQDYKFIYGFRDEYVVSAVVVNKNGAKGVLSMIADDGDQKTADFFYTVVAPKYSAFKVSIAMPTRDVANLIQRDDKSYVLDEDGKYTYRVRANDYVSKISCSVFADTSAYKDLEAFWDQILTSNQFEIISHSHSHGTDWSVNDEAQYDENGQLTHPEGNVIKELQASAQILEDLFGQGSPFIARPGGIFWADSPTADRSELRNYFYALVESDSTFVGMRSSTGGPPLPGAANTKLNSPEQFAVSYNGGAWENYPRLNIGCLLVQGNQTSFNEDGTGYAYNEGGKMSDVVASGVGAWTNYVDLAMEHGQWASIAFHYAIDEATNEYMAGGQNYNVAFAQVLQFMDYVQPLVDSGDLWVGTFSEVAEYYFQWSTATVTAKAYGDDRVEVTLNDREEDPRMDSALTVKVNVPGNWTAAELDSYGVKTSLEVHVDEDGNCFVYANIVPGEGVSVITPVR